MARGRFFGRLRQLDWSIIVITLLLILFSIATIYSIAVNKTPPDLGRFWRQISALGIGLVACLVLITIDFRVWHSIAWVLYGIAITLLVGVLFFGTEIRGTKGWFVFEPATIQFQPVEIAKVLLVIAFARFIADRSGRIDRPRAFVGNLALMLMPVSLVAIQPDLGSAVIIVGTWVGMLLVAELPRRFWVFTILGAAVIGFIGWNFVLQDYHHNRIQAFLHPELDPLGVGYNITQSIVAVGSGELFGRGLGLGPQSRLNFLPEQETDFIFAVIAEELGFVGAVLFLGLFALLLFRIIRIARQAPDDFSLFAVSGFAILFFIQLFVNIGTNIGLLPVAGVPLPLVSYGGSSLIASLLALGFVQSVAARRGTVIPLTGG